DQSLPVVPPPADQSMSAIEPDEQASATALPAEGSEFQETLTGLIDANKAQIASAQPQFEVASDAQEPVVASEPEIAAVEPAVPVASVPAPVGRLVYASVEPLEKGAGSNYHGSLARDGSELVFSSNRLKVNGKNVYQCFSKKPEASAKAARVFEWAGNVWTPELTPDGSRIVFSSDSTSPEHLFVYDRKSGKTKALTSGDSKNMMCAVSPDGRLVAFTSSQKGKPNDIWLIGIDGDNLLQLTSGVEDDREPRWSADGSTLYFTRIYTYMKKSHIMKIQLDPLGEAQPVVANNRRNWLPDISPDGSALVFVRSESEDGSKNTLVVRQLVSGEEAVVRPLGEADCLRPIWAPDGSGLVFHASIDDSRSLYFAKFKRDQQGK
ncbi:MAG: WD40-like protein Beta Propeller, partial [uncultured bacterium]